MNTCIFCKIISGSAPSYKVWEDNDFLAFLSIRPVVTGHTLVIPKKHSEYLFDMSDELLQKALIFSKPVANLLNKTFKPSSGKVGMMVAGLEMRHTHLHLIPLNDLSDLSFAKARDASQDELKKTLEKIKVSS